MWERHHGAGSVVSFLLKNKYYFFRLCLTKAELVALHTDDFGTLTVKISRQEVKTYCVDERGERHRIGYELSPHTKTLRGERELYLCEEANEYLKIILDINAKRGFHDGYLFLDADGNHSIRKTCISKMIESKNLTNEEIRAFAGHEDYATAEKYYDFSTASLPTRKDAFERALSGRLTGKCNQV